MLTFKDFESLYELDNRILSFQKDYGQITRLSQYKFTNEDRKQLLYGLKEEQILQLGNGHRIYAREHLVAAAS